MATPKQIEDLKNDWLRNPVWDLEHTDGFEEHKAELRAWRIQIETERSAAAHQLLMEKAEELGCPGNVKLAAYIIKIEREIQLVRCGL